MSSLYDIYLRDHIQGVKRAFDYMSDHGILQVIGADYDRCLELVNAHDSSKYGKEEYDAYDEYFYGKTRSDTVDNFNLAWLHHIHSNPHHWQYWLLKEDSGELKPLAMPVEYVVEMVCDWWSFSWKTGNLHEIFDWYTGHETKMVLNPMTKAVVTELLGMIKESIV